MGQKKTTSGKQEGPRLPAKLYVVRSQGSLLEYVSDPHRCVTVNYFLKKI